MMRGVGTIYSHSRLSTFENCRRQFRYRYVDQIRVETEGIEAFMGKLVHSVAEKLNLVTAAGQVPSLAAVLRRYQILWQETFDPCRIRIAREGMEPEHYRAIGARCTENLYRSHYPFDETESIGIEENVRVDLDPEGRYRLRGVVDRIVRTREGGIEIHDYKTGARVPRQDAIDKDRQLALYQLALTERFPDEPIELVWHYLANNQVRRSRRDAEQLETLRRNTIERIDAVEAERDFAPTPSALCRWCEYNDRCEAGRERLGITTPRPPDPPPQPARAAASVPDDQLQLFS
jgi:RecB family exonuclease